MEKRVKTIRLLSTSLQTGTLMSNLFKSEFPEAIVYNIIDDSIVQEIIANKNLISADIVKRVCNYVVSAELSGAELVVICCSTISGTADIARSLVSIPVMGIDEPMADTAVSKGERVMVLATMTSTLEPSLQLLRKASERLKKSVIVDSILCQEARNQLDAGAPERHDEILLNEIDKALRSNDLVILAQASMARVKEHLPEDSWDQVLTSPPIAIEYIKKKFFQ